jgi:hypothetical protein
MTDRIKVIDSPCGTGKTSYAIDYINKLPLDQKILYIAPFLTECKRIQDDTTRKFVQPDKNLGNGSKRIHFLELIQRGENISSTHALFSTLDDDIIFALKDAHYILILDEVFQVLDKFDMWDELPRKSSEEYKDELTKINVDTLISKKFITVDQDFKVRWIDYDHPIDKYNSLRRMVEKGLVFRINGSLLVWTFPCEIFQEGIFDEIFILTYLFDWQIQKYYYDFFQIKYKKYHIEKVNDNYNLVETGDNKQFEIDWRNNAKSLITILDNPKLNKVGDSYTDKMNREHDTALSMTWYKQFNKDNVGDIDILKKNIINYFLNITHSKARQRMWTCFEGWKDLFRDDHLATNSSCWIALNSRSTNDFKHKRVLAYPINRFLNPYYQDFFDVRNIEIDNAGFAISEFIQWIWRSRIRDGYPIQIYIPSKRMRNLLIDFLDFKF